MTLRKAAGLLVAAGLMLGLIGAGVSATFTDSATATTNISVGTFGLQITTPDPSAVVVNTPTVHSVTLTCPDITSSALGNCHFVGGVTLTNVGTIPMTVAVAWNTVAVPFQAIPILNSYSLAAGAHVDLLQMGIFWAQPLTNANLNQTITVTYTFTATA